MERCIPWVQPQNGIKQGNFEPAVFLVAPKKQMVANLGWSIIFTKNMSLNTEVATEY